MNEVECFFQTLVYCTEEQDGQYALGQFTKLAIPSSLDWN
jgi:hypothetical protein